MANGPLFVNVSSQSETPMSTQCLLKSLAVCILTMVGLQGYAQTSSTTQTGAPFQFLALNKATLEGIQKIPSTSNIHSPNEKRVVQVVQALSQGDLVKATRLAQALSRAAPHYALANLLYVDLLRLHALDHAFSPTTDSSLDSHNVFEQALSSPPPQVSASQLELALRLKSLHTSPSPGKVPSHIVSIGSQYKQLVVADTQLGRMSIFDIQSSTKGPRFTLKHSFFMTIGEQGPGKQLEGDKKTPLGIYQLLSRVPQDLLTDLYGSGALNINYPNPVDRRLGRTGFGIWFHGSPSNAYVRPPFSSDGCLVLSNDDMNVMLSSTTPQQTLVIVDDGIEWQSSQNLVKDTQTSAHPVHSKLTQLIINKTILAPDFKPDEFYEGESKWDFRMLRLVQSNKTVQEDLTISNITLVDWTRNNPYAMVEFDFQLNPASALFRFRQYWINKDGEWKIIRESKV
jgi:hypothetical protein